MEAEKETRNAALVFRQGHCVVGRQHVLVAVVLQGHAAGTETARAVDQVREFARRTGVVQAFGTDIGNAVALGVGETKPRTVGKVDSKAVGLGKPGPFAYQHHHLFDAEKRADLVAECDSALACDYQWHFDQVGNMGSQGKEKCHGMSRDS